MSSPAAAATAVVINNELPRSRRNTAPLVDSQVSSSRSLQHLANQEVAREFIETVLGAPFPCSNFHESLKSGVLLCQTLNALIPNTVKQISYKPLPFLQMENISNFIIEAGNLGVRQEYLFRTVDLYEAKGLNQVAITILEVMRITTGISAAKLTKLNDANKRIIKTFINAQRQGTIVNRDMSTMRVSFDDSVISGGINYLTVLDGDGEEQRKQAKALKAQHQMEMTRALSKRVKKSPNSARGGSEDNMKILMGQRTVKRSKVPPMTSGKSMNPFKEAIIARPMSANDALSAARKKRIELYDEETTESAYYQLGDCIGKGQFGSVYKAFNLQTGEFVAIKRIHTLGLDDEEVENMMKEVEILRDLDHPYIVKYEGFVKGEEYFNIILELMENGSLLHTLKTYGSFSERLAKSYILQLLDALCYLHSMDVVHCDIKAANLLTTKRGSVKLADFGVSLNLKLREGDIEAMVAGTPNWMAPEIIELKGPCTASDIWSLGCTIIEFVTGSPPYSHLLAMTTLFRIVEDEHPPLPENISEELKDFLLQCFRKEPNQRPTADQLKAHSWLATANITSAMVNQSTSHMVSEPTTSSTTTLLQETLNTKSVLETTGSGQVQSRSESNLAFAGLPVKTHYFVKGRFSRPVTCRLCTESIKKKAVLYCGMVFHDRCGKGLVKKMSPCDAHSKACIDQRDEEKVKPTNSMEELRQRFKRSDDCIIS